MIPPDVASALRLQLAETGKLSADQIQQQPVAPASRLADILGNVVPGQRILAEIQSLLPNGTYRAMVNQRSITLALPFSARSGDTLELQVTESDGNIALAVVAHRQADGGNAQRDAVSATLSRTAQFISQLFTRPEESGEETKALALNGNRPIASAPPNTAQDLLPLLKQAIAESGMFYESHQAEWVEGRFAKSALLREPQGKLSSPEAFAPPAPASTEAAQTTHASMPAAPTTEPAPMPKSASDAPAAQSATQLVAPQTQGIVQQQLDALATQHFVWQGQVWPGQDMRWEIDEEDHRRDAGTDPEDASGWSTRLTLRLPNLGEVDARIRLQGGQIALAIAVDNPQTQSLMQAESAALRQQLGEAGLTLTAIGIAEESAGTGYEEASQG